MNALLWVLQVLLAAAFFAHGMLFLMPPANMVEQMSVLPTLVSGLPWGRGSPGRDWSDAPRDHTHPATAGTGGRGGADRS